MKRSDFHFDLPAGLIAQRPLARRSDSRLLHLERRSGQLSDHQFTDLPDLLRPEDLLVFNDTRVLPARLFGHKTSGGRVEILIERQLSAHRCLVQLRSSKPARPDSDIVLEDQTRLTVESRDGDFFTLHSSAEPFSSVMSRLGHVPLPPYIERDDEALDQDRYQTVYGKHPGAVAAPTAGLHFDPPLLGLLQERGIRFAHVTLHVGAGTFQPVREEQIEDHRMHAEYLEVSSEVCAAVDETRVRGGRVIAVGTTSVRCLETAAGEDGLQPFSGDTRIFIYPGYEFRAVDGIITNFHLPESTLLMLVSAFAGIDPVRVAYRHAMAERYRFFSYGDAMFIL